MLPKSVIEGNLCLAKSLIAKNQIEIGIVLDRFGSTW